MGIFSSNKDRRAAVRVRMSVPAKLMLSAGSIECSTIDVSATRAKVALGPETALPAEFDFWFSDGPTLRARLIWRTGEALGIHFV
jgi:hypothetical protein